jgi:flagellar motility protein MotE (MotC chaperone)
MTPVRFIALVAGLICTGSAIAIAVTGTPARSSASEAAPASTLPGAQSSTAPSPASGSQDKPASPPPSAKDAKSTGPAHDDDTPPSLSVHALCDELQNGSAGAEAGGRDSEERKRLAEERANLEKMAADIAQARAALQSETARLEALVKQNGAGGGAAAGPSVATAEQAASAVPFHPEVVVKALRGLKAEQAALVMKKLRHSLAAQVLGRMRSADAAAVVGKLEPAEAAELLTEAARTE